MDRKLYRYKFNIYLMYAYWFFHNLIFAYVIERLYWASRGMTNQQVVYTEIVYAAVVLLLEVPTGSLADRWSKKKLLAITAFLSLAEFIILIYAKSFWYFALAVSMAGIGKALSSGTSNALVYDSLKMLKKEQLFEKVSGRIAFFDYTACMLASLIGSFVAYRANYITTYWLSLISLIICCFITWCLVEPKVVSQAEKTESYSECIKEAFSFLKAHKTIRFILLFGIVTSAVFIYIDEFWQIYLKEIRFPIFLFGIVSSVRMLSSSISGIYAYKLKKRFSYKQIFNLIIIVFIVSLIASSFANSYLGLIPLLLCFTVIGVVEPLTMGYLHHRTESKIRATVESFQSLVLRAATIICGLLFGYFSTKFSIFAGFRILGVILAVYAVYYFIRSKAFMADDKQELNI
jgi:MFS family permease